MNVKLFHYLSEVMLSKTHVSETESLPRGRRVSRYSDRQLFRPCMANLFRPPICLSYVGNVQYSKAVEVKKGR